MIKMAFLGAGGIAIKMANTIAKLDEVEAYGVSSIDLPSAQAFADKFGFKKAYASYEEMLQDDAIDLVYVATPHSHHYKYAKMSLEAGKNVLCEKSFTINADQARDLFRIAEEKHLLLTEAIWTRYMPSRKMIDDIIKSGVIGEVTSLVANLGYDLTKVNRIWEPSLAGGALLDCGVYAIHFARMVFGENVTDVTAKAVFKNGVDMIDSITMTFDDEKMATAQINVKAALNRDAAIFGTKGSINIANINNPQKLTVLSDEEHGYEVLATYDVPEQNTGYEYEVEACRKAIENGEIECPQIPHAETVKVMEIMDDIRKSWGYEIPIPV